MILHQIICAVIMGCAFAYPMKGLSPLCNATHVTHTAGQEKRCGLILDLFVIPKETAYGLSNGNLQEYSQKFDEKEMLPCGEPLTLERATQKKKCCGILNPASLKDCCGKFDGGEVRPCCQQLTLEDSVQKKECCELQDPDSLKNCCGKFDEGEAPSCCESHRTEHARAKRSIKNRLTIKAKSSGMKSSRRLNPSGNSRKKTSVRSNNTKPLKKQARHIIAGSKTKPLRNRRNKATSRARKSRSSGRRLKKTQFYNSRTHRG